MRRLYYGAMVLALSCLLAQGAMAADTTNFANDAFASQISMHAFNQSVKNRMQVARFAFYGDVSAPPAQGYVAGNVAGCPTSSFNVWADGYVEWGKQKTDVLGYKFNVAGPALGFDWSNGPLTVGIATTYNWGKLKARDIAHERKTRTFGATLYGQFNYERFYVNADLGYGRNRFKSRRWTVDQAYSDVPARDKYHSDSWSGEIEIGTRLNICNLVVEPHIGLSYFADRRKSFDELRPDGAVNSFQKRNYHSLEMPLGVDVSYTQGIFNSMFVPRVHFAWIPQFKRKYGRAETYDGTIDESVKRARHGFEVGAGLQFKVFKGVSAHVDYTVNMRSKAYEHMINAGLGWSF